MCQCVTLCNEQLKKDNAAIDTRWQFGPGQKSIRQVMFIPLVKLDSKIRKPLPTLAITFCPVCGEKQIDDEGKPTKKSRKTKGYRSA